MGEAQKRSRAKADILASESRCIYCASPNSADARLTLEHMPPISMFRSRERMSGMEYASCESCNVGTKGADIAAAVMAMIAPRNEPDDWKMGNLSRLLPTMDRYAPGLRTEVVRSKQQQKWLWTPRGLIEPHVQLEANGPILKAYLGVFAAKMAMALYREHVGEPLPLTGAAYTMHFLNSGLNQAQLDGMLSIMPVFGELRQGRKSSTGQFAYRFNCDDRTIVGAIVGFHDNLHIMAFATSDPATYGKALAIDNMIVTRPGELVSRLEAVRPPADS